MGNLAGDSILGAAASAVTALIGWMAKRLSTWQRSVEKSVYEVREDSTDAILNIGIQLEVLDSKMDHLIERIAHLEGVLGVATPPTWHGPERRKASPARRKR